jgi:hypothetical protein
MLCKSSLLRSWDGKEVMCEMRDLGFESYTTHIFHMKNYIQVSSNLKYFLVSSQISRHVL